MSITLYDYTLSGSCYKVRLLLRFLGLDYQRQLIDFYPGREHKSPDFLDINPLGQLPALRDGDLLLRDAQAILCHLAHTYDASGQWLPRDDRFGQVMMWLMFAGGELMSASAARLHDVMGYALDIKAARANAHAALRVLEDHMTARELLGCKWLVGNSALDAPTIADVACFPYVALAGDGGIGHEDYPALRNWMGHFRRLENFHPMPGIPEFV